MQRRAKQHAPNRAGMWRPIAQPAARFDQAPAQAFLRVKTHHHFSPQAVIEAAVIASTVRGSAAPAAPVRAEILFAAPPRRAGFVTDGRWSPRRGDRQVERPRQIRRRRQEGATGQPKRPASTKKAAGADRNIAPGQYPSKRRAPRRRSLAAAGRSAVRRPPAMFLAARPGQQHRDHSDQNKRQVAARSWHAAGPVPDHHSQVS